MENNKNDMCESCKYKMSAEKDKTPDLGEMLKLAMMVSKLFNQMTPARQSNPEPSKQNQNTQQDTCIVKNVDEFIEDKKIKIIKSALPYLHPELQRMMHLVAKCLEIKNILNSDFYASRIQTSSTPEELSLGMLKAVSPHLAPDEKHKVDIACKALEMILIMRSMEKLKSSMNKSEETQKSSKNNNIDIPKELPKLPGEK